MDTQYYLTHGEMEHYRHMLDKGYWSYNATIGAQSYKVFPVVDKEYACIVWPTSEGELEKIPPGDIIFITNKSLQDLIIKQIPEPSVLVLLFPLVKQAPTAKHK